MNAQHVETLRAMRTMFREDRIPSPCSERDALDAAIAALSAAQGDSTAAYQAWIARNGYADTRPRMQAFEYGYRAALATRQPAQGGG